jgi:HNH endonuclease
VTVDLDGLLGRPGAVGGEPGWMGPLDPETCRRLACDGAVTRVLVTRHPSDHHHPNHGSSDQERPVAQDLGATEERPATQAAGGDGERPIARDPGRVEGLATRLRAALALLPPVLGGAPTQPLEVGRASRVVPAGQRAALVVRDRGCGFPGCGRPPAWCEAHHLWHWLHGGPTDLSNLALLCRAHHRAVHEGGWQLQRQADGRLTATPPHRRPHTAA